MSLLFRPQNAVELWQRRLLAVFCILFLLSGAVLLRRFYVQNTDIVPSLGGTYIEGAVGEFAPLNPWFTITNDVNRDIVSLVFAGLQKYNPETKEIEDDLATMTVSEDGRLYTLKLKDNLYWHDSSPEDPHPVTPEDVLFTFQTIQDPAFPNSLLRQNFQGVELQKIDDRTVRFRLEQPYSFFPSNLTIGLLPARAFEGVPINRLDQALDFGFAPVGAGPYAFKSLVQTELSTEVTLEYFPRPLPPIHKLERVIFRIFPDYSTLLSDIRNLEGVRLVPRNADGDAVVPNQFTVDQYTLPQYVALFFNMDKPILQDRQLRLGLQLGTDKQAIANTLHEPMIVDTPLLEINTDDWRYQFDAASARGAFFESDWNLPEKVRLQKLLEEREANRIGVLQIDPVVLLDTGAIMTVTGSLADADIETARLNGARLEPHPTQSGAWIAALSSKGGTGAVRIGRNLIRLTGEDGRVLDSFYLWRTTDPKLYRRAREEQRLVELFVQSRTDDLPEEERLSVEQLFLENGMLRLRLSTDPTDIRVNAQGERLSLRLLTSASPASYKKLAEQIATQWAALGVHVGIDVPATRQEFEEKLLRRDYDILLFGQSLLDNLDSYPYWHSSGLQKETDVRHELSIDAYNLSQYSSFEADTLLEVIRKTRNEDEREQALSELREILKRDVPAVFLYSPLYTFAYQNELQGVELGKLSLHSDRFLTLHNWYAQVERQFHPGMGWISFFPWLLGFR